MEVVIVEGKGAVLEGEFGASHCNQWVLCDALFSNYFDELLNNAHRTARTTT